MTLPSDGAPQTLLTMLIVNRRLTPCGTWRSSTSPGWRWSPWTPPALDTIGFTLKVKAYSADGAVRAVVAKWLPYRPNALADQLSLTAQNVQALSSDIAKVPPVKLAINQAAFNASLAEVRSQLNSLSGVAIVTARLQATQLRNELRQMQMDGQADGSIMQFANGGFRGANIMQFAGGGFRGAGIYSDGADIVRFAERGTGGEAYIPLASSKRARSTKILAETNRLMGNPLGAAGASLSEIRDAVEAGVSSALAQGIMGEFRGDFGNVDRITGSVVADLKVALRRA